MTFTITGDKTNNIEVAKNLLSNLGIKDFTFANYSSTNFGTSIYFISSDEKKIRVSDHSVTSNERMKNECLFSFDMQTIKRDGTNGFKDNQKSNLIMATKIYKIA